MLLVIFNVFGEKNEDEENGSWWIIVMIKLLLLFCYVQWIVKSIDDDIFILIDINVKEYKGIIVFFFYLVLVVRQVDLFEKICF